MPKSFIKIKPIKSSSEEHNTRKTKPHYLVKPSNENVSVGNEKIKERRSRLEKIVKEKTGRKMQKKATPIREAVVLLPDDDNEYNEKALFKLTDALKEKFGIECFQWHIHNDEGHFCEKEGVVKYNYHAHLVFDWINHETGKSYKLSKEDMSEMQTITAELLEMERGLKGSKNLSLNHREYRSFIRLKEEIEKDLKQDLSQEKQKEIRKEIIKNRDGNEGRKAKGISR